MPCVKLAMKCLRLGIALILPLVGAAAQTTTSGVMPGGMGWYFPTRDRAGEIFVFELGTGSPVIVLHGGPGADYTYMLPIANGLDKEFQFIFYDQRGSLRSRVVADSITVAKHVEDLETLRAALGVKQIVLVSHSAGTLLAYEYLKAYPANVANLVLVGALPHKNGKQFFDAEYAALWQPLPSDAKAFRERDAIPNEIRKAGIPDSGRTLRQAGTAALIAQVGAETFHVERWREALPMRVNPDAARRTRSTTTLEYDYGTLLGGHPFPVTVINGEFDYTVGPKGSPLWRRLAETQVAHLNVVVIPNAGHIVWRDEPQEFRRALREALSKRR